MVSHLLILILMRVSLIVEVALWMSVIRGSGHVDARDDDLRLRWQVVIAACTATVNCTILVPGCKR